jgi:hypothetical protein
VLENSIEKRIFPYPHSWQNAYVPYSDDKKMIGEKKKHTNVT